MDEWNGDWRCFKRKHQLLVIWFLLKLLQLNYEIEWRSNLTSCNGILAPKSQMQAVTCCHFSKLPHAQGKMRTWFFAITPRNLMNEIHLRQGNHSHLKKHNRIVMWLVVFNVIKHNNTQNTRRTPPNLNEYNKKNKPE